MKSIDSPGRTARVFTLVHSRLALPGARTHPARGIVQKLVGLVKLGGYIQQVEILYTSWPDADPAMREFYRACVDVFTMAVDGQISTTRGQLSSGIPKWAEDVHSEVYTIPIGAKAPSDSIREIRIESFVATCQGLTETA